MDIENAPAKGAEFLDNKEPGWAEKIGEEGRDKLDICSGGNCILAQLTKRNYDEGLKHYGIDALEAPDLGLDVAPSLPERIKEAAAFAALTDGWKTQINQRLAT